MTLDHWLDQATAGLPPEVAGRVRAEYAAHIAESDLPEADAVAALGPPKKVRRALGRTYLGGERLETLRSGPGTSLLSGRRWLGLVWTIPLLYTLMLVWIWGDHTPFPWWRLTAPAVTLLLMAGVWPLFRGLPPERRTLWQNAWGGLSTPFMLWLQWTLEFRHGEGLIWPGSLLLFAALMLGSLLWTVWEDQRLRRTLALRKTRP